MNDEASLKFIGSFFSNLIEIDPTNILITANEFEKRGDILFRYTSSFFESVFDKCNLLQEIYNYDF